MSVTADKLPNPAVLLGVFDTEARRTATEAQRDLAPIVARETPRGRTGRTARTLRPKVTKTSTGQALTVAAPRGTVHSEFATVADVVRWVTKGTGVHGPGHRRIRSKRLLGRMTLPGGRKVYSVKGQRPNPFIDRIRLLGGLRVERAFKRGAERAARAVEKRF